MSVGVYFLLENGRRRGRCSDRFQVVNMSGVEQVVAILENYPITRETLERTRIGKYINEMRKKTNNKELSKRAKELVRSWRNLISVPADGATVNGDQVIVGKRGVSPAISNRMRISPALSGYSSGSNSAKVSPQITGSRPNTPAGRYITRPQTPNMVRCSNSPSPRNTLSPAIRMSGKPLTPNMRQPITPNARQPLIPNVRQRNGTPPSRQISPGVFPPAKLTNQQKPHTPSQFRSKPNTPIGGASVPPDIRKGTVNKFTNSTSQASDSSALCEKRRSSPVPCTITSSATSEHLQNKTNVANLKRTRSPYEEMLQPSSKKAYSGSTKEKHIPNGDVPWLRNTSSENSSTQNNSVYTSTPLSSKNSKTPARNARLSVKIDTSKTTNTAISSAKLETATSDMSSPRFSTKTPKVKTTAQLIAGLQAKTGGGLASETVNKINRNLIEKEIEIRESIVPAGAKPRPRRMPGLPPSVTPNTLSRTKTEMVERYLESTVNSDSPSQPEDIERTSPIAGLSISPSANTPDNSITSMKSEQADALSNESDHKETKVIEEIDPWSLLPPLNLDEINWQQSDTDYEPPVQKTVTDTDVYNIHNKQLPGINGYHDYKGDWHDWSSTMTLSSFEDDPLVILPYVNIDD